MEVQVHQRRLEGSVAFGLGWAAGAQWQHGLSRGRLPHPSGCRRLGRARRHRHLDRRRELWGLWARADVLRDHQGAPRYLLLPRIRQTPWSEVVGIQSRLSASRLIPFGSAFACPSEDETFACSLTSGAAIPTDAVAASDGIV